MSDNAPMPAFEDDDNECPGCVHYRFAGVVWPARLGDDASRSWVERCVKCSRYESDHLAAIALGLGIIASVEWADVDDGRRRPYLADRAERDFGQWVGVSLAEVMRESGSGVH